jgi:23S rRNA (cytosine1962-C5)-methyltransferase
MIKAAENWRDYELLDCGSGEKTERWGTDIYIRPDPQIIWQSVSVEKADVGVPTAHYRRSDKGGGQWEFFKTSAKAPRVISYPSYAGELQFTVHPTDFKHMGLFPEQAVNWDSIQKLIAARGTDVNILNLFAYTGGATVAAAKAGARVCHVDAAKGMVDWAKQNAALSGLQGAPIRYITDDCGKFVGREKKRGVRYDGIIMDPPSYGRGPGGEVWKLEDSLYDMVKAAVSVMSDKPLFFLLNSYTTGLSAEVMEYLLISVLHESGYKNAQVSSYVLGLPCKASGLSLPCGSTVKAEFI